MTLIDRLKEIKFTVESLENDLMSQDAATYAAAEKRYLQLLDVFYEEDKDIMAEQQYEACKTDYEYFLRLLVLAIAYWQEEMKKDESGETLH